jgi:hypothetical protein
MRTLPGGARLIAIPSFRRFSVKRYLIILIVLAFLLSAAAGAGWKWQHPRAQAGAPITGWA